MRGLTPLRVLGGLAAGLAAILAAEIAPLGQTQGMAAGNQAAPATPAPVPPGLSASVITAGVRILLTRPPFTPGRRGDPDSAAGPVSGLARLSGTIVAPQGRYAIMEPDGDRHPIVIGLGGVVDGWTIQWIGDGSIRISRDGTVRTILARFKMSADPAVLEPPLPQGILRTRQSDPHLQP